MGFATDISKQSLQLYLNARCCPVFCWMLSNWCWMFVWRHWWWWFGNTLSSRRANKLLPDWMISSYRTLLTSAYFHLSSLCKTPSVRKKCCSVERWRSSLWSICHLYEVRAKFKIMPDGLQKLHQWPNPNLPLHQWCVRNADACCQKSAIKNFVTAHLPAEISVTLVYLCLLIHALT